MRAQQAASLEGGRGRTRVTRRIGVRSPQVSPDAAFDDAWVRRAFSNQNSLNAPPTKTTAVTSFVSDRHPNRTPPVGFALPAVWRK